MARSGKKKSTVPRSIDYREFISQVRLVALSIERGAFNVDRERFFNELEGEKGKYLISAAYKVAKVGKDFFDTLSSFDVSTDAAPGREPSLRIVCSVSAHFHCPGRVDPQSCERFANSEMKLIVWPFFRQFAFDATSRMSIPPVAIPLSTELE